MSSTDDASSVSRARPRGQNTRQRVPLLICVVLLGLAVSHEPLSVPAADPSAASSGGPSVITGDVTYRERLALPAGAVLQVRLLDVLADAPAVVVVERTIKPTGNVPIRFELRFDPKRINPAHTYVVHARLTAGTREWITTSPHPVLTNGAPATVSIELH